MTPPTPALPETIYESHGLANTVVLRTALFRVGNPKQPRRWYRLLPPERCPFSGNPLRGTVPFIPDPLVETDVKDATISYSGEELRQDDLTVAMLLAQKALNSQAETASPRGHVRVSFKPYPFVRELGWSTSKESVRRLAQSIHRLSEGRLSGHHERLGLLANTALLSETFIAYKTDENRTEWSATLTPAMLRLLEAGYTFVNLQTRSKLTELGQWLHAFICTQPYGKPLSWPIAMLATKAGLQNKDMKAVKKAIAKVLQQLQDGCVEVSSRRKETTPSASPDPAITPANSTAIAREIPPEHPTLARTFRPVIRDASVRGGRAFFTRLGESPATTPAHQDPTIPSS